MESFEDAARRLIGVMDERAKRKTAERSQNGSENLQDQPGQSPSPAEKSGDGTERKNRSAVIDVSSPRVTVADREERGNGWVTGEVYRAGPVEPNDVTMRSPARSSADSDCHVFTVEAEGARDVRWRVGK